MHFQSNPRWSFLFSPCSRASPLRTTARKGHTTCENQQLRLPLYCFVLKVALGALMNMQIPSAVLKPRVSSGKFKCHPTQWSISVRSQNILRLLRREAANFAAIGHGTQVRGELLNLHTHISGTPSSAIVSFWLLPLFSFCSRSCSIKSGGIMATLCVAFTTDWANYNFSFHPEMGDSLNYDCHCWRRKAATLKTQLWC